MVDVVVLANAVGLLYIFFFAGAFVKKPRYRATVDNYIVVVVTVGDSRVFSTLIETVEQLE
ncbi:MAG: egghead, partial [Pyrobaculum sp.]